MHGDILSLGRTGFDQAISRTFQADDGNFAPHNGSGQHKGFEQTRDLHHRKIAGPRALPRAQVAAAWPSRRLQPEAMFGPARNNPLVRLLSFGWQGAEWTFDFRAAQKAPASIAHI